MSNARCIYFDLRIFSLGVKFISGSEAFHRILHLIINNMGVNLGGADIGMAQGFLHHAKIFGLEVEVSGESVP